MNTYRIAVVEGDGIGPEVIGARSSARGGPAGFSGFDSISARPRPVRGPIWNRGSPSRPRRWRPAERPTRSCSARAGCPGSAIPTAPRSSPRSRSGSCSTSTRASGRRGRLTASLSAGGRAGDRLRGRPREHRGDLRLARGRHRARRPARDRHAGHHPARDRAGRPRGVRARPAAAGATEPTRHLR